MWTASTPSPLCSKASGSPSGASSSSFPLVRGKLDHLLSAEKFESVFAKLYGLSHRASFHIKTTEAQHYRRYVLQQQVALRRSCTAQPGATIAKVEDNIGRAPRGLNDGKGFVFVSHTGEVFPSGFLPFSAGNVRSDSLSRIYRESPIFRQLRDPSQLVANVVPANSARSAAAPAPAPTPLPEILWPKNPAAPMCPRTTAQQKSCLVKRAG
jgi:hypothetical protein